MKFRFTVLALALLAIWSFVLHWFPIPDKWMNWGHTAVSAVASILLGLMAAIYVYEYQKSDAENEKRAQLKILLLAELKSTVESLTISDIRYFKDRQGIAPNLPHDIFYENIQPLILEEAGRTNLFETEKSAQMLRLARLMRTYNSEVGNIHSLIFLRVPGYNPQALVDIIGKQIELMRQKILAETNLLQKGLEKK